MFKHRITHLQSKHGLSAFQNASGHRPPSAFAQTAQLKDPLFQTRDSPPIVVEILNIKGPTSLYAQLIKFLKTLQTAVSLHPGTAFASLRIQGSYGGSGVRSTLGPRNTDAILRSK